MKRLWIGLLVYAAAVAAVSTASDEPAVLKECRDAVKRLEGDVQKIEKDLRPLEQNIKTRRTRINELTVLYGRLGTPIDQVKERLRILEKELEEEARRSGGLVKTGTGLNKVVAILDGGNKTIKELQRKIKDAQKELKEKTRTAEQGRNAVQGLPSEFLEISDLSTELTSLKKRQHQDEGTQRRWSQRLASKRDDLMRKRKECENLEKRLKNNRQEIDPGRPTGQGIVTYIGPLQIPTPKSGMDLPIEDEIEPKWPNTWEYLPLMQIDPTDARTKAYYDALRTDFGDAILGEEKSGNVPPVESLFKESGAEYAKLMDASEKAGWKGTPIRFFEGSYIVRVICAGQTRYRGHVIRPDARSTRGGFHFFGLQPGRHPVKVTIATADGQRFEAQFAVIVKYTPHMMARTVEVKGKDGKTEEKQVPFEANLAFYKSDFESFWSLHMRDRSQTQGKPALRREILSSGVGQIGNYVDWFKSKPGCTASDISPLLVKGAGALALLLSEFGSGEDAYKAFSELLRFARICHEIGSPAAHDVLSAAVQQAAGVASSALQNAVGTTYDVLGDVAFMQGRFQEAVKHYETGLKYHQRAKPDYSSRKEQNEWPDLEELKRMQALLGK